MKINLFKLSAIILLSLIFSTAGIAQCTFGNFPAPYSSSASFGANYLLGTKYYLASTGTLTGLGYKGNGTGASMQMAIYNDVGGVVGTLVANTATTTNAAGNTTLSIGTPTVIPAGWYWVMGIYNGGSSTNHVDYSSTVTTTVSYISLTFGTPPPTSASWVTYPNQDFNYWAVINGTPPTVIINSSTTTICSGNPVSLVANGATSYSWNTGSTSATITPTPTTNTTYTVTGSAAGCVNTAVQTITVNPLPTVVATGPGSVCAGSSANLIVSGTAITYSWSTGTIGTTTTVTPVVNTTYTVWGIDVNGCIGSYTQSITAAPQPTISVISTSSLLCAGQSASLIASGASTYSWSTGSNGSAIGVTPSVTTTYSLVGTGPNTCTNSTTFTQSVSACTGISELQTANSELKVFPNPTNSNLNIELNSETTLTIYNSLGEMILNEKAQAGTHQIDLSGKAIGVYVLKTNDGHKTSTIRIVKN
jgi:hypothetical protein